MSKEQIKKIIEQFRAKALVFHDHPQNAAHGKMLDATYDELAQLFVELDSEGHREELKTLLTDPDKAVQAVTASFVLSFDPQVALPLLEKLQFEFYGVGTVARKAVFSYKQEKGIFLKDEEVKQAIREAFKYVRKGNGIGAREAEALDNYAGEEDQQEARAQDTEEYWWDIPLKYESYFTTALSFTDIEGFRFLLPASMSAAVDQGGSGGMGTLQLCGLKKGELGPYKGSKLYLDFLKSISPKENAEYYGFTSEQIHAIALFLLWDMQQGNDYLLDDRQQHLELTKRVNKNFPHSKVPQYELSIEDQMAQWDEECRILGDWLKLGGVKISQG